MKTVSKWAPFWGGIAASVLLHGVVATPLLVRGSFETKSKPESVPIRVVAQPAPSPVPKPPPEKAPEKMPEKTPLKPKRPEKKPVASERTPKEPPPKTEVTPVQGLSKESMDPASKSGFAAPLGNTLMVEDKGLRLKEEPPALAADLSADAVLIRESVLIPKYTDQALDAGFEGTITVEVLVDATGAVTEATLAKSVGYGMDQRILAAAKQARFKPRLGRLGQPESGWTVIKFKMEIP